MPCYSPLPCVRHVDAQGKKKIIFGLARQQAVYEQVKFTGGSVEPLSVPCGQCVGCRIRRSTEWAFRCIHEAELHEKNCFITCTYAPEHLPSDYSLKKKHFVDFLKRLRKALGSFRFYMCGEYGEGNLRPHYHAILFGVDFNDKELHTHERGIKLYRSPLLTSVWGLGHCTVGAVTYQSAAYVARYVMKKITGRDARDYYLRQHPETGEKFQVLPEYTQMSLKRGIGYEWYKKYRSDCYPSDYLVKEGKKFTVPRYYDKLLDSECQELYEKIKRRRREKALLVPDSEKTPERQAVKQFCCERRIKKLVRTL